MVKTTQSMETNHSIQHQFQLVTLMENYHWASFPTASFHCCKKVNFGVVLETNYDKQHQFQLVTLTENYYWDSFPTSSHPQTFIFAKIARNSHTKGATQSAKFPKIHFMLREWAERGSK